MSLHNLIFAIVPLDSWISHHQNIVNVNINITNENERSSSDIS